MRHTEESKNRLSEMRKGKNNPFYGKKHTAEAKEKMRKATKEYNIKRQYSLGPRTIKEIEDRDLMYLAGMVDADGSIRFRKDKYPFVAVYNQSEDLMKWLTTIIGGKVTGKDKRGRKPSYQWTVQGARDVFFLCYSLLPNLIVKGEDAIKVIIYLDNKYGSRIKDSMD
jgi:hypothetical protein